MQRLVLGILVMVSLGLPKRAVAEPAGSRKPRPPSAAILGAGKDEEGFAVASQAAARPSPGDADLGLLRALLFAAEPAPTEIRVLAVEDLALVGDPRALNPLSLMLFDLNPAVQQAALRAVTHFQHPRAEQILCNVVRHPLLPERMKTQALEALLFQRSSSAQEFLARVQGNSAMSTALRDTARRTLAQWNPLLSR